MRKILIIKLSSLGDIFMALPHIEAVVNHHPGDTVYLLTTPPFADLFAHHPRLKTVILDRSKWLAPDSSLGRRNWIRQGRFDVVYDLQGNRISRMLVRASKAPVRVGKKGGSVYTCHPPSDDEDRHVFERLTSFVAAAGVPEVPSRSTLYPSLADTERVARWKTDHGILDGRYVIFHAGSSPEWPSKRWPADYYEKLALLLEQAGFQCIWVGGRADEGLNHRLASRAGVDATGKFNTMQLYLLGENAAMAVTNDSGPMHILAAAGIPVFTFFGPTNWFKHHAVGQKQRVMYHPVDCGPCYRKKCPPRFGHICMHSIQPKTAFSKIQQELGDVRPGSSSEEDEHD
ncbi:MAG: glycosyltransferase family 9 protein [Thermodesulfobacteriota bacterium]